MSTELPVSTALDVLERVVGRDALLGPGHPALDDYGRSTTTCARRGRG